MPFPWKKKKKNGGVSRISNFVADLQSPKRGGSLVVETGFPTSLIDLFVKNRSRFKKPKPNKPVRREIPDPPAQPPKSTNRAVCRPAAAAEARYPEAPTGSDSDPNQVIAALAKMLVVFVVTLSVNKLTLGITISAFVLLFIEFAGKRFVSCLKPCENANAAFKSLAGRVFSSCTFFRNPSPSTAMMEGNSVNSSSDSSLEIEIVETGSGCDDESELIRCSTIEEKKEEEECEISSVKTKRSGKLKSKIVKKLVPKKLRSLKKDKEGIKEKMRRASSCSEIGEEDVPECIVEENDDEKVDCEIINQEVREVGDYEIDDHQNEHEQEKMGMKSINSESGCVMLILITLAGLVEGRFLALILTITWIFMLKMLKSRGRSVRSLNVPLFFKGSKQILS